jgi:hypothetical protein
MAFDLDELGVEEFIRRRRFLGETYLMSHDTPVGASTLLRTAWSILTDGEPPPELPRFDIV